MTEREMVRKMLPGWFVWLAGSKWVPKWLKVWVSKIFGVRIERKEVKYWAIRKVFKTVFMLGRERGSWAFEVFDSKTLNKGKNTVNISTIRVDELLLSGRE